MEYLSNLPIRLKELAFYHEDIKSDALGKEIGVSGSTVRAWLRGELTLNLANAVKLADFFGCSLDYLAGRSSVYEEVRAHSLPPFYEQVRKIMKSAGVTRYRVTADTIIKDSYFTNWANGATPKLTSVCALADYLNVSLDYLVGRTDY